MKCPSCGAEVGTSKYCEFCGSQMSYTMQREQEQLNKKGCPECGSSNIRFNRENQGELRGKNTKRVIHRTVGFCADCGATWYPNSAANEAPKKRRTWLWILGWVFIFPVPLTILIYRNERLNKWLKVGIIAAGWIFYLLIVLGNQSKNQQEADPSRSLVFEGTVTVSPTAKPTAQPTSNPTAKPTPTPAEPVIEGSEYEWEQDDEGWRCLNEDGELMTGWVQDRDVWYFMDENGVMQTGWLDRGDHRFYLKESGVMAESETLTIDGKKYSFDGDGYLIEETPTPKASGVTPEFKESMDSYEAFFNEYCEFMKAMSDDPTNFNYLLEYTDMLTQYADTMEKLDAIDEKELSPADDAYYIEVMARIEIKLLEAAGYMS